ncbi:MAG: hypothetical protein IPK13_27685 [Deltaproteobacteria bacterium]|nr:hypothetical protein [Deltaproteobacteria bacterium]
MDHKTKGAWVVHHARKLASVTNPIEYENILTAGRAGILLSALSADDQIVLPNDRVHAIRKAAQINSAEFPALLEQLKKAGLIQVNASAVEVLGVSTQNVLVHTANLYAAQPITAREEAVIHLAEATSALPLEYDIVVEEIADTFKLPGAEAGECVNQSEEIGFVDAESIDEKRKLYFNGNIFRKDNTAKMGAVFASLDGESVRKLKDVDDLLKQRGALTLDEARHVLGKPLFDKLHAAGVFDVSEVANDQEKVFYVTRPAAFGKFGNPFADDALDLAKAFVTCLTYGMTRRTSDRGRIQMVRVLLRRLIEGRWIGPATAIGQDYRVLEMRRVIELRLVKGAQYEMRLLKREVGELAFEVLSAGEATDGTLQLSGAPISRFTTPEETRSARRKKQTSQGKRATLDIITALRTGKR